MNITACNYRNAMEPHRQSNPDSFALNESTKSIRRDLGSSLPRPVAGGLLDPFTTYPECETKDADINILLKYCLSPPSITIILCLRFC